MLSKHEYDLLKSIAYCVLNMRDDENDGNLGLAAEWKIELYKRMEEYIENDYDCNYVKSNNFPEPLDPVSIGISSLERYNFCHYDYEGPKNDT